jgi:glyoxylase-like metal-dependent hydrolase (beta-lactamase superfamily II)
MSEYPKHIEVLPNVHLVRGENGARFPEANTLLIDDEILTLVDAGSSMENISGTLRDLNHEISDIQRIVLTHFHIDHKGYAADIQKIADCELMCHPLAETGVRTFKGLIDFYGIKGHKYYDAWESYIALRFRHVMGNYNVTSNFTDGKTISCGENELIPIHLPGHTIDHTCFGINGYDIIFLTDIDLTNFGPWYGNKVSDIEDFKKSVEQVIDINPKVGISSHLINLVTDDIEERLRKFRGVFDEREKRVLDNIDRGIDTIEKLSLEPTIYPRIPMDIFYFFEMFMLEKHIELLKKRGEIIEEDGHLKIVRG